METLQLIFNGEIPLNWIAARVSMGWLVGITSRILIPLSTRAFLFSCHRLHLNMDFLCEARFSNQVLIRTETLVNS